MKAGDNSVFQLHSSRGAFEPHRGSLSSRITVTGSNWCRTKTANPTDVPDWHWISPWSKKALFTEKGARTGLLLVSGMKLGTDYIQENPLGQTSTGKFTSCPMGIEQGDKRTGPPLFLRTPREGFHGLRMCLTLFCLPPASQALAFIISGCKPSQQDPVLLTLVRSVFGVEHLHCNIN